MKKIQKELTLVDATNFKKCFHRGKNHILVMKFMMGKKEKALLLPIVDNFYIDPLGQPFLTEQRAETNVSDGYWTNYLELTEFRQDHIQTTLF